MWFDDLFYQFSDVIIGAIFLLGLKSFGDDIK